MAVVRESHPISLTSGAIHIQLYLAAISEEPQLYLIITLSLVFCQVILQKSIGSGNQFIKAEKIEALQIQKSPELQSK